jgi:hypothetical protein
MTDRRFVLAAPGDEPREATGKTLVRPEARNRDQLA